MSMLGQIFGAGSSTPVANTQNTSNINAPADNRGAEYLSKFSAGQTVEGKVTDIKGNEVQIELPNGGSVNAKLDNAMSLTPGQILSFEVRTNSGQAISLTPLYTNLTIDPTAVKALGAAGMEVNSQTLSMAASMMENGMNIDSKSLGDMYHLISSQPGAEPAQIVEMQKLGLKVNEESVEQYAAFKNFENQLSEGVSQIAEDAVALYDELMGEDSAKGIHFLKEFTDVFAKEQALPQAGESAEGGGLMAKTILNEDGSVSIQSAAGEAAGNGQAAGSISEFGTLFKEFINSGGQDGAKPATQADAGEIADPKQKAQQLIKELKEAEASFEKDTVAAAKSGGTAAENVKAQLSQILGHGGAPEQLMSLLDSIQADDPTVLKLVNTTLKLLDDAGGSLKNKELEDKLKELLKGDDLKSVVKEAVKESWSLKPEQVADKSNVEQLYQRLNSQSKELTQSLNALAQPGSSFAQSLGNMSNNLDFMNQMNQAMQYVQIPLRMNGSETTGDLYVYTNKKNLAGGDGSVSAMLHLDMEHMGTVDVYASISGSSNVSTRFYLESDEMIDFLAEHIHILNERLEQRGYNVKADISSREAMKDGGEVRSLAPPTASKLLSKQSFDMRA